MNYMEYIQLPVHKRLAIAQDHFTAPEILQDCCMFDEISIVWATLENPNVNTDTLCRGLNHGSLSANLSAVRNPKMTPSLFMSMFSLDKDFDTFGEGDRLFFLAADQPHLLVGSQHYPWVRRGWFRELMGLDLRK